VGESVAAALSMKRQRSELQQRSALPSAQNAALPTVR
jgi:hypothetical protein